MEKTSVRQVEEDVASLRAELEAAYRERDAMGDELMETKKKLSEVDAAREQAIFRALEAENTDQTVELRREVHDLEKELASARESLDNATKSAQKNEKEHGKAAKEWAAEKKELEKQLEEARIAAEQVSVDDVLSEDKRAEIEAEVSRVYEEKLEALRRDADKRVMAAGNPVLVEVNLLFGELQDTYARISGALAGLRVDAPDVADKLTGALKAALRQMLEG